MPGMALGLGFGRLGTVAVLRSGVIGAWLVALLGSGASAGAATLVFDNFDSVSSGAGINGRTPTTTLNGATWVTGTGTFLGNGGGGLSADSTKTQSAYIDLGAGYLSSHRGVYDLALDITNPAGVAGSGWIGFGFAPEVATGGVKPGQNLASANAAPWLLFRVNGQEIVFQGPGNSGVAAYSSTAGTVTTGVAHTYRLQLDTTGVNWTLNAFRDGGQLDLNGGAAGSTYTYATNPTGSHYVALSTGVNGAGGVGTIDNLSLTFSPAPIPQPAAAGAVIMGVGLLAGRWRRR